PAPVRPSGAVVRPAWVRHECSFPWFSVSFGRTDAYGLVAAPPPALAGGEIVDIINSFLARPAGIFSGETPWIVRHATAAVCGCVVLCDAHPPPPRGGGLTLSGCGPVAVPR